MRLVPEQGRTLHGFCFFFFLTAFLKYPSQTIFYTMYFTRKGILFVPHASGISCTKQQLLSRSRMLSHRL